MLKATSGFRSTEAAIFYSQLEDQTQRLFEAVQGITPEELEWQPAPGMNTPGMLLAHFAVAEVLWAQRAFFGMEKVDTAQVLGHDRRYDGMPMAADGQPPAHLRGKKLSDYQELLSKARAYYREGAAKLTDADMENTVTWTRGSDGTQRTGNLRWVMYHIVEHFASHFGQLLLMRRLYKSAVK